MCKGAFQRDAGSTLDVEHYRCAGVRAEMKAVVDGSRADDSGIDFIASDQRRSHGWQTVDEAVDVHVACRSLVGQRTVSSCACEPADQGTEEQSGLWRKGNVSSGADEDSKREANERPGDDKPRLRSIASIGHCGERSCRRPGCDCPRR